MLAAELLFWEYCLSREELSVKASKNKLLFISMIAVIAFALIWIGIIGTNKGIEKTVHVNVYTDSTENYEPSRIFISGNLKKSLLTSTSSFVGTFAMEAYEKSCRDGVEAKIKWSKDYQRISFFYAGDFSTFDVKTIAIDEQMEHMTVVFNDGTMIAAPDGSGSSGNERNCYAVKGHF